MERAVQIASPPFDDETADIILRTSDNVEFRVYSLILSLASPVFKTMFALPQKNHADTPIITISEDSSTLDALLSFCYPVDAPRLSDVDLTKKVMEATTKYDMPEIIKHVQRQLLSFVEKEPLRVFAISYYYEWEEGIKLAARECLSREIIQEPVEELDAINAMAYHHLLQYHKLCGIATWKLTLSFEWLSPIPVDHLWVKCPHNLCFERSTVSFKCSDGCSRRAREWLCLYIDAAKKIIKDRPCTKTITPNYLRASALGKIGDCPSCRLQAANQLDHFVNVFSQAIEKAIDEVKLELKF
ncbi:hypothetical protein BDQ12DRAFT_727764 [Crucibulum laeve]|uniref:BTB domain-containing protein n=1 Tax=Crucibulum laeve TaxID=68775 RepID=A0A5C3LL97_9AGAR|nr:hypothetical protein BDQ12DRAFT_727764 [Crucibulum laeve]